MRRALLLALVALVVPELGAAQVRTTDVSASSVRSAGSKRSRTLRERFADTVNVRDFGARGDAVYVGTTITRGTDDTAAIQAAINAAAASPGRTVVFPPGTYSASLLTIPSSSGLTITGTKATVVWNAPNARFDPVGVITNLTVENLTIRGNGVLASAQRGIANASGQYITGVTYRNLTVSDVPIGFSVGSENGGAVRDITIEGNTLSRFVGVNGGEGYGIHVAGSADTSLLNATIRGNKIDNAERHAIYVARGRNVLVINNQIREHRKTINSGTLVRPAIAAGRGAGIAIIGNSIDESYDGAIGTAAGGSTVTSNIVIAENVIANPGNAMPLIQVGPNGPPTTEIEPGLIENTPQNVLVARNSIQVGTVAATPISLTAGRHVTISGNLIVSAATASGIDITALGEVGTATYTDDIKVSENTVIMTGANAAGLRLLPDWDGSTAKLEIAGNHIVAPFPVYASATISNPNVFTDRQVADLPMAAGLFAKSLPNLLGNVTIYGTSAPAAGTWKKGDRMINSAPAAGQPKAWTCSVAGTPGTWTSEGNL